MYPAIQTTEMHRQQRAAATRNSFQVQCWREEIRANMNKIIEKGKQEK
jgi:hypothetical protein